jgi:DNA-binding Xre family transcriptional regulator
MRARGYIQSDGQPATYRLSVEAGLHYEYLHKLIRDGNFHKVGLNFLSRLCDFFKCQLGDLLIREWPAPQPYVKPEPDPILEPQADARLQVWHPSIDAAGNPVKPRKKRGEYFKTAHRGADGKPMPKRPPELPEGIESIW